MKKLILFITMTALALPIGAQTSKKGIANMGSKQTAQVKTKATTSENNTQVAKPTKKAPTLTIVTPPTPEHQVYTGKFTLPKFSEGEASYSYLPSPTGERIFDGPFNFIRDGSSKQYTYRGNFKNNRQVGTWEFASIEDGDTIAYASFQFNDFGILDGTVYYGEITGIINNYIRRITFQYSNGRVEGPVYFEDIDYSNPQNNIIARGNYQNDEPIGTWEFSNYPYPIVLKKDKDANSYWETTTIEESTGDKTIQRKNNLNYFYDINSKIEYAVEKILQLRDSKITVSKSDCIYLNSEYDSRNGYYNIFDDSSRKSNTWLDGIKLKNKNSTKLNNRENLAIYILDNISLPTDVQDTVANVFIDIFYRQRRQNSFY